MVNSTSLHLSLPGEKLHHIRMEVKQLLKKKQVTARQLAQIIGKLNVAFQAVLSAPLFYRSIQGDLQRIEQQQPELQCSPVPITSCQGRTFIVARDAGMLERQSPTSLAGICDRQVRCISPGLGGSMQWYQDRRSLEPVRTTASHKLPGVACGNSGSEIISEGSGRIISFTTVGQSDSCGLH